MTRPTPIEPNPGQESVWDYPRPPRLERTNKHIQVVFNEVVIVDSRRAWRVLETSHPPVYYIPPDDIRMELMRPTTGNTWCEWKGEASYYDVVVEDHVLTRAAWAYPDPRPGFEGIQHYIAFYPSRMDRCSLDGEVVVAQEGDFYGGWITSEIVGPFKGAPGTRGW